MFGIQGLGEFQSQVELVELVKTKNIQGVHVASS